MSKQYTDTSKFLSYVLRHEPQAIGLTLNQEGWADIAALIAPRALLLNFGETDSGSPIDEVRAGIETIRRAYDGVHAGDKFQAYIEEQTGHVLSDEMWRRTKDWFAKHLCGLTA